MSDRGDTSRDVLLRVRVENLSTAGFKQVSEAINLITSSLDSQVAAANRAEIKERELAASLTKLDQAARNLAGLDALIARYKNFDATLASSEARVEAARKKLADYRQSLEASGDTTDKAGKALARLVTAYDNADKALTEQKQKYADLSGALQKAGVDLNNLTQFERDSIAVQNLVGQGRTKVAAAILDLTRNQRLAKDAAIAERAEQEKLTASLRAQADARSKMAGEGQRQYQDALRRNTDTATVQKREYDAAVAATKARVDAERERAATERAFIESAMARSQKFKNENLARIKAEHDAEVAAARAKIDVARAANAQIVAAQKIHNETMAAEARRTADIYRKEQQRLYPTEKVLAAQGAVPPPPTLTPRPVAPTRGALTQPGVRGEAQQSTLLGLRPYELQNLSYQINDIITGLASGQAATQVLAQQGGQVLQLFSRNLFGLVRFLPQIVIGVGAATIAISALHRAFSLTSSIREFQAAITLSGQGTTYTATQLTELRKRVQDLGVSWKDSGDIIRQAVSAGVRPEMLDTFTGAARDMAKATGIEVPAAMKKLVTEFGHGFEAIEKSDEILKTFTLSQYSELKAMSDSGRGREAARRALEIYAASLKKTADEGQSPWSKAVEASGVAWRRFIDQITPIGAIEALNRGLDGLTDKLKELKNFADNSQSVIEFLQRVTGVALGASGGAITGAIAGGLVGGPPGAAIGAAGGLVAGGVGGYAATAPGVHAATAQIPAGSVQQEVQAWLLSKGYSAGATAAIMGNASVESSFNPAAENAAFKASGGAGGHFGLFQWDKTRRAPLGGSTDVARQMELMDAELSKLDPAFKTAAASAGVLADRFEKVFERSGGQLQAKRISEAERFAGGLTTTGDGSNVLPDVNVSSENLDAIKRAQVLKQLTEERIRLNTTDRESIIKLAEEEAKRDTRAKGAFDKDTQDAAARQARQLKEAEFAQTDRDRQAEDTVRLAGYRQHLNAIVEAGAAAAAKEAAAQRATGAGLVDESRVRAAQLKGEAEARAKFQEADQAHEAVRQANNIVSQAHRENSLKHSSQLEQAEAAVNEQYKVRLSQIEKLIEQNPGQREALDIAKQKLEVEKQSALGNARIGSFEAAAREALTTRRTLVQTYDNLEASGDITISEKESRTKAAFALTSAEILGAANNMEKFLATAAGLDLPPAKIALMTARIAELRSQAQYVSPMFTAIKDAVVESFTSGLSSAFNTVGEALGGLIAKTKSWKDVWDSVKSAALSFFSSLLRSIAEAIIKLEAAKIASSIIGDSGGGGGGFFGKALGFIGSLFGGGGEAAVAGTGGLWHQGGVVGHTNAPQRAVQASWFANAPRYHSGRGAVGLAPDEQAAILQRGEEVLSRGSPRNIMNGGGSSPDINIRSVLLLDRELIPSAMAGTHGEQTVMAHIRQNIGTIRQMVKP